MSEESTVSLYLKEISRAKTLTLEEEAELALRIRQGDRRALNKLIRSNLKFVVSVCRNYQNQGLSLADLINEGNLGLIRAAKRFDETKQFKFISYAVWWIRQAILQALAEQSRIIKVPLNKAGVLHRMGRAGARLEQRLSRPATTVELAGALGVEEREILECRQLGASHLSLDAPMAAEDDGKLMDTLKDESVASPDDEVTQASLRQEVARVLGDLAGREGEVLKLYFGIGIDTSHTLEEIGLRFNLTRERVRQIKEKAIRRLRHVSRSRNLCP